MMHVFNILLISLSIATILLTLVSYILYKAKQLPRASGHRPETRKVEGVFFRRYTPGEASAQEESRSAEPPLPGPIRRFVPQTTGAFFAIVAAVIFLSLLAQRYLIRHNTGESLSEGERKALMAEGLLKHFKLTETSSEHLMEEFIFPQEKARLEGTIAKLRGKKILLLQSPGNQAADHGRRIESLASWAAFLDDVEIPYRKIRDLAAIPQGTDLVVLARAVRLSGRERESITAALNRGIGFLATGPIGVGDGKPDSEASFWREKTFGVRLLANPTASNLYPTLFVAGTAPWWEIPAGLDAPWYPEDVDYKAVPVTGTSSLYEGDYRGSFNGIEGNPSVTQVTREQLVQGKHGRAVWLAFDPMTPSTELSGAEKHYVRSALVHSLAWSAGVPSARVSSWLRGRSAAMAVFVDTEFKFENIDDIAEVYKKHAFPGTFFVVSNLFRQHPEMMDHMAPDMEIESHSEDHKPFDRQPLAQQFERIQTSRLEIEPISRKRVIAFRPPTEKFDPDTVNASLQNGMLYFAGERTFLRYAPTWIASGKMLFFSRVMDDDINLKRAGLMDDPDDLISTVTGECDVVGKLNGLYLLGLHTQYLGRGEPLETFSKLLASLDERPYWKTNFLEVSQWWKGRLDLSAELVPGPAEGHYQLTLKNDGDTAWGDFGVELDTGSVKVLRLPERATASEAQVASLVKEGGITRLMIPRINPKDTLTFDFETEP